MIANTEHENSSRHERDLIREVHIEAYYSVGHSLEETGKKFGISRQRVRQILQRNGVKSRQKCGSDKNLEMLERVKWCLYLCETVEFKTLCELFGVPMQYAYNNNSKGGLISRKFKFTYNKGDRILNLWNQGFTYQEIREYLKITDGHIGSSLGRFKKKGFSVRDGNSNKGRRGRSD